MQSRKQAQGFAAHRSMVGMALRGSPSSDPGGFPNQGSEESQVTICTRRFAAASRRGFCAGVCLVCRLSHRINPFLNSQEK